MSRPTIPDDPFHDLTRAGLSLTVHRVAVNPSGGVDVHARTDAGGEVSRTFPAGNPAAAVVELAGRYGLDRVADERHRTTAARDA